MIATIAVIAEKKKNFSDRSDHMKLLSSDRSDNNRWDIKRSLSLRSLESGFHMIAELFFSAIAAITVIVAIIWKPVNPSQ